MKKRLALVVPVVLLAFAASGCSSETDDFCQTFKDRGGTAPDLGLYLPPDSIEETRIGLDHRIDVMDLVPPEEIADEWETVRAFFIEKRKSTERLDYSLTDVFLADDDVRAAMDVIGDYHGDACLIH